MSNLPRTRRGPSFGPVHFGGLRAFVDSRGLTLATTDYHAAPVHLTRDALRELGLVLPPRESRRLQPSVARLWRAGASRREPGGTLPVGLALGGYVVARVSGGLDVFVTSYHSEPLLLDPAHLRKLGLRVRKTPLKPANRTPRLRALTR